MGTIIIYRKYSTSTPNYGPGDVKKVRRDENTTSRKDESPMAAKKGKTANYTAQHETVPKVEHHDFPRQSLPGCHGFLGGRRVQDIAKLG